MSGGRVERRLTAILAADVAGYSRLMGQDEAGTLTRLKAHHRKLIAPSIAEYKGRLVKTTGDGMLIEFPSVIEAVSCAVAVQRGMVERNTGTAADQRIVFRVGVNLGDIIVDGEDIFGDGVNVAARLETLAEPGGICTSRVVRDQIRDKLPYTFDDMGEQSLKNISRPVHAYALSADTVAATPLVAAPAELRPAYRRMSRRPVVLAAGAVAILILAVVGWLWLPERSPSVPVSAPVVTRPPAPSAVMADVKSAPRLSIVVLPFANLSNDPEQEYFADGITDMLTTDLSRIAGSFVIARNTAFTYKGKPTDAKQIGRDLGVRYVLEGSVRRAGDQVQVNVQLIDAESGGHLWADRFDTERSNLVKEENAITARLARSLDLELVAVEAKRSEQQNAVDPDAVDLVMRGWAWLYRPASATTLQEARRAFEGALKIDPRSIDARIDLASALVQSVGNAVSNDGPQDLAHAEQLTLEAIEQDATRSKAHRVVGIIRRLQKDRLREAQIAFETALALDPNDHTGAGALAWVLMHLGEPEAAIVQTEKALRLSPRDPGTWSRYANLGLCYLLLKQVDLAIDYFIKARTLNPRIWWVHYSYCVTS